MSNDEISKKVMVERMIENGSRHQALEPVGKKHFRFTWEKLFLFIAGAGVGHLLMEFLKR